MIIIFIVIFVYITKPQKEAMNFNKYNPIKSMKEFSEILPDHFKDYLKAMFVGMFSLSFIIAIIIVYNTDIQIDKSKVEHAILNHYISLTENETSSIKVDDKSGFRKYAQAVLVKLKEKRIELEYELDNQSKEVILRKQALPTYSTDSITKTVVYENNLCDIKNIEQRISCDSIRTLSINGTIEAVDRYREVEFLIKRFETMIEQDYYPYIYENVTIEEDQH